MTAPLRPCPGCSRHVRASEPACPFCRGELDDAFRSAPRPRAPTARLSRAALFAIGAAGFLAGSVSCSSGSSYGAPPPPCDLDGSCDTPYLPGEASVDAATVIASDAAADVAAQPCSEPQQCIYGSGAFVCRQTCSGDATACPSGQVCTSAPACCGSVLSTCGAPVMVCCSASGC
jgi:hypothetical protein